MNMGYNYTPGNRPESNYILLAVVMVVLAASTFVAFDYGLAHKKANAIAEVTWKDMKTPDRPGESPYMLAVSKDGKTYHVRVPKFYYNEVDKGSYILIAELRGRFTDHVYQSWIFDGMIPLKITSLTLKVNHRMAV